jgi:hypothetical protein
MERRYPPSPPARRLRDRPTATAIPFPLNPVLLSQDMQEHGNRHRYPPNGGRAITRMPNPKRGRSRSPHARRSRELRGNAATAATRGGTLHYRAVVAQWKAERQTCRPKVSKLAAKDRLREYVQDRLSGALTAPDGPSILGPEVDRPTPRSASGSPVGHAWSPKQLANQLRTDFPDDESMRISHETIYQAIYVRGRGAPRRELTACLRTGRALRVPRVRTRQRARRRLPGYRPAGSTKINNPTQHSHPPIAHPTTTPPPHQPRRTPTAA